MKRISRMSKLSKGHIGYLKLFTPTTVCVNLPYGIAKTLEIKGLVEWMPPQLGAKMWAITNAGRKALAAEKD